jgi:hypothetical protein
MNGVREFVEGLRAQGCVLELREPDRLHVEAPAGVLTEGIRARLAELKPEILGLLRPHSPVVTCCPVCDERQARPDPLENGCQSHGITAAQVATWWEIAEQRAAASPDFEVSVCICCGAPSPDSVLICRRCE